jgi:diguanylate cyclase (GGDEF)-like protein
MVGDSSSDTITISEKDAPRLAGDLVPFHNERMDSLLRAQQEVMTLILSGAGLNDILKHIVLVVEDVLSPALCLISLVNRDGGEIRHRVGPNLPMEFVSTVGISLSNNPRDPTEATALTGERIIVADFSSDPQWAEHAEQALAHGLHCCWVEPIPDCGEGLFGLVSLYYPTSQELHAGDQHTLLTLTSLIRFAISAAQRQTALRVGNERFAALVSAIPGVVYQRVVTPDNQIRYVYISEGARDLFGASPDEILADPEALFKTHSPEYKAKFRERLLAASKALTIWDVEATLITPDGRKKYTHAIARPDRQDDGSVLWTGVILDETRTRTALVNSLSQGFLLFDAQDCIVIRNSCYLELYPALSDIAVPGATYEDIIKAEIASDNETSVEEIEHSADFRERLKTHQHEQNMLERQLGDDRWILVHEQRTSDGGTIVLYTDISELKRREKQIRHLAYHDALTGLPNRVQFHQQATRAIARARRQGKMVAVMCLDIDHFKYVNDSLGHASGDALLKSISKRLRRILRENDVVARLGGDEFGIVLTDLSQPDEATDLAWRLLNGLIHPINLHGQQVVTGVSIGIAMSPTDGDRAEMLLKCADLALYRAKADGRGAFRFFEAEMDARAQARRALEIDLRQAVANKQFQLYYQSQVDIRTNKVVGFEALVRWHHPDRGTILPADFIPLAEETGIIIPMGKWILRQACTDAKGWPESIGVAVNVSPAQFRHRDLTQVVAQVLTETGLEPHRLELEITESLLLHNVEANLTCLQELKALGVRIAMDDFGTGYSSLANLRSFPFDKIKIDGSFVMDLRQDTDSEAIIRAVLGLSRSLGMTTCAEGVETNDQLKHLRKEGCNEVQGYFYSTPMPADDIAELQQPNAPHTTAVTLGR